MFIKTFAVSLVLLAAAASAPASAGVCWINLAGQCQHDNPQAPKNDWFQEPWYPPAHTDQVQCMQRAADFQRWCGSTFTYASHYDDQGRNAFLLLTNLKPQVFTLRVGHALPMDDLWANPNGKLYFQTDGNLVLRQGETPLAASSWAENNSVTGKFAGQECSNCKAELGWNGELILSDNNGTPYWRTYTGGNPGARMLLGSSNPTMSFVDPWGSPLWTSQYASPGRSSNRWVTTNPRKVNYTGAECAGDVNGCRNAVSWTQIPGPGMTDYFIGRAKDFDRVECNGPNGECNITGEYFTLSIGRMNWSTNQIELQGKVVDLYSAPRDFQGGKYRLTNIYDPSIMHDGNEYWVAFECGGEDYYRNPSRIPGWAASCMAPIRFGANGGLDVGRAYVAVLGVNAYPNDPYHMSASVPKLFRDDDGRVYLYWTVIKARLWPDLFQESITTRGIELVYQNNRWEPKDYGIEMPANHPLSQEVFGTEPERPGMEMTADAAQITKFNGSYYLIGHQGGCTDPRAAQPGCYRMTIRKSGSPLGNRIFNQARVPEHQLPSNSTQYPRFLFAPDGNLRVLGHFSDSYVSDNKVENGTIMFDINPASNFIYPWVAVHTDPTATTVTQLYRMILKRDPDVGGLQWYTNALFQGYTHRQILTIMAHSQEARVLYGAQSLPRPEFVNNVWYRILGYGLSQPNLDIYANAYADPRDPLDLVYDLLNSAEFRARSVDVAPVF